MPAHSAIMIALYLGLSSSICPKGLKSERSGDGLLSLVNTNFFVLEVSSTVLYHLPVLLIPLVQCFQHLR